MVGDRGTLLTSNNDGVNWNLTFPIGKGVTLHAVQFPSDTTGESTNELKLLSSMQSLTSSPNSHEPSCSPGQGAPDWGDIPQGPRPGTCFAVCGC